MEHSRSSRSDANSHLIGARTRDRATVEPAHSNGPQDLALSNQAMLQIAESCPVRPQAKPKIGQPGDRYEQEADRVADQVMRMSTPGLISTGSSHPAGTRPTPTQEAVVQRECAKCEEQEEREEIIHAKEAPGREPRADSSLDSQIDSLKTTGRPLPNSLRGYFEPRFGRDFSDVRVHTDSQAAESARGINALAYTVANHIVFDSGQYAPETTAGKWLMAHELTHVTQQKAAGSVAIQRQASKPKANKPITAFEAFELGEQALITRIASTREALATAKGDEASFHQVELANLKEGLINVCVAHSQILSSIASADLLYSLNGGAISVIPASEAGSALERLDAESIVSCEKTERLILQQAFATAGASFSGAVQIANPGSDEYRWLEAYRKNDSENIRRALVELDTTPHEDEFIGPSMGAQGAGPTSTVELVERELNEKGIDTIEELKAELEKELESQRQDELEQSKATDSGGTGGAGGADVGGSGAGGAQGNDSSAGSGGAGGGPTGVAVAAAGVATLGTAREIAFLSGNLLRTIPPPHPLLLAAALVLGVAVLILMAPDYSAQRRRIIKIAVIQRRLAELGALATGTALAVTQGQVEWIEKRWEIIIKEMQARIAALGGAAAIGCVTEWTKFVQMSWQLMNYVRSNPLEDMDAEVLEDLEDKMEDALYDLEDCLGPESDGPDPDDGEPVPVDFKPTGTHG